MGRILEGKFGDEKKVEKKRVKPIASEGHAMAGREGFGKGKWVGQARSNTPGPMGWAGGLFTLRASCRGHLDVDAHVWHDVPVSGAIRRKVLYASTQLARTPFCVMRRAGASGI